MSNLILKKSSFIHIPKCAGTSVQSLLFYSNLVLEQKEYPQYGHLFLHQMEGIKDKYNFAFVRHPYTWWPSFHNWSKQDRFTKMERSCKNFDQWLLEYGPFWLGLYSKLIQRYIGEDPLYPTENKINFVGKSENLFEDLKIALNNAGEDISEETYKDAMFYVKNDEHVDLNQNIAIYDRSPISAASKELIYNSERYVFERFGYSKNI